MKQNNIRKHQNAHPIRKTPLYLGLFFLALLLAGIAVDEPTRILEQARQICLSCIGIG